MKIVTYIKTINSVAYKSLLLKPFNINLLYDFNGDDLTIFDGWKGRCINDSWFSLSNDNDDIIEYYPAYYMVKLNNKSYKLPIPITINDFINDMDRCGIDLYWKESVLLGLQPQDYLSTEQIIKHYKDSLLKIDKSYELNI